MAEFITMQCPNCGGKLSVGSNTLTLVCENCGTEHMDMVRREAGGIILEAYARCPVCNRNDRAEKVSAILRSQTHSTAGVAYQPQVVYRHVGNAVQAVQQQVAIPVQTSQVSELARHLVPPARPPARPMPVIGEGTSSCSLSAAVVSIVVGVLLLLAACLSGPIPVLAPSQFRGDNTVLWIALAVAGRLRIADGGRRRAAVHLSGAMGAGQQRAEENSGREPAAGV